MKEKRWSLALVIVAVVVIASAIITFVYHDSPGSLYVRSVSDGSGGAITAWQNDNGTYVQRIDSEGKLLWKKGGIQINNISNTLDPSGPPKTQFTITADGAGGAIITWADTSNIPDDRDDPAYYDPVPVYSQRISPDGDFLWSENTATGITRRTTIIFPQVIPDGTGGAIFTWNDFQTISKSLTDDFLRIQKLSPAGEPLWGDNGILLVSSSPFHAVTPEEEASGVKGTYTRAKPTYDGKQEIISDSSGGVIVFWTIDTESGSTVYGQRVDHEGNTTWADNIMVASVYNQYLTYKAVSDDNGGALVVVTDSGTRKIKARHITGDGDTSWQYETTGYHAECPSGIISNPGGGAFLYWGESEPVSGNPMEVQISISIQKLDGEGNALWQQIHFNILTKGSRYNLDIAADGAGGIIAATRIFEYNTSHEGRVYLQKRDAQGDFSFPVTPFPNELKYQGSPIVISNSSGGAIIIAAVGKGALQGDMVYAQSIDANGDLVWEENIRIDR